MDSVLEDLDDLDRLFNDEVIESGSSNKSQPKPAASDKKEAEKKEKTEITKTNSSQNERKKRPRMPKMKNILPNLIMPPLDPIPNFAPQTPNLNQHVTPIRSTSSSVFDSQALNQTKAPAISRSSSSSFTYSLQSVEERITKYLETKINDLAKDFTKALEDALERANDYSHVVTRFTRDLNTCIKQEIDFKQQNNDFINDSFIFPNDVKIKIPKPNKVSYLPLTSVINEIRQKRIEISSNTSINGQKLKEHLALYKQSIHERNKAYKQYMQHRSDDRHAKKELINRQIQLEIEKRYIEQEIELLKLKQRVILNKKESDNYTSLLIRDVDHKYDLYTKEMRDFISVLPRTLNDITDFLNRKHPAIDDEIQENTRRFEYIEYASNEMFESFMKWLSVRQNDLPDQMTVISLDNSAFSSSDREYSELDSDSSYREQITIFENSPRRYKDLIRRRTSNNTYYGPTSSSLSPTRLRIPMMTSVF